MTIAYLAHPVRGNVPGAIEALRGISRRINMMEPKVVPFAPYVLDLMALDDDIPAERARGIANDNAILSGDLVTELRLYGDRISEGMRDEIELAQRHHIPIRPMSLGTFRDFEKMVKPVHVMGALDIMDKCRLLFRPIHVVMEVVEIYDDHVEAVCVHDGAYEFDKPLRYHLETPIIRLPNSTLPPHIYELMYQEKHSQKFNHSQ